MPFFPESHTHTQKKNVTKYISHDVLFVVKTKENAIRKKIILLFAHIKIFSSSWQFQKKCQKTLLLLKLKSQSERNFSFVFLSSHFWLFILLDFPLKFLMVKVGFFSSYLLVWKSHMSVVMDVCFEILIFIQLFLS